MNISHLEANYESVQAEYNRLVREEERFEELAAEDLLQVELNFNTTEAETTMMNMKQAYEAVEGDINALLDKLSEVTVEDVMDEINDQIGYFQEDLEYYQETYLLAQESFNTLAKEKIAAQAAREASQLQYEKDEAFNDAQEEILWYERKIADLEARLVDFEAFSRMPPDALPACGPGMYLDWNAIPQLDITYALGEISLIDGF